MHHLVWKIFHVEQGITSNTEAIEEKNTRLIDLRNDHSKFDEAQKAAKKESTKAQKEVSKQDKVVKKKEKDLEEAVRAFPLREGRGVARSPLQLHALTTMHLLVQRPDLVAIDARLAHAAKKLKSAEANTTVVQRDLGVNEGKLATLEKDLARVNKEQKAAQGQLCGLLRRMSPR